MKPAIIEIKRQYKQKNHQKQQQKFNSKTMNKNYITKLK